MRSVAFVLLFALAAVALARPEGKFTTKYDNVDLDNILSNDRLLKNYVNCILDRGTCTNEGTVLKKAIPNALTDDCSRCSEKQKNGTRKVIFYLAKNKRDIYKEVTAKYDPQGIHRNRYKDEFVKEGIEI